MYKDIKSRIEPVCVWILSKIRKTAVIVCHILTPIFSQCIPAPCIFSWALILMKRQLISCIGFDL